jgi:hypothetical protein
MLIGIFLVGGYQIAFAATASKPKKVVGSKVAQDNENPQSNGQSHAQKEAKIQAVETQDRNAANDGVAEERTIKTGTR